MPSSPAPTSRHATATSLAAGLFLTLVLAGCSGGSDNSAPTTTGPAPSAATTTSTAPGSSTSSATTASSTAVPTSTVPTSTVPTTAVKDECTADQLDVAIISNGVAAGTQHYAIVFTNRSARMCVIQGYPGASFVDKGGVQVGKAAGRSGTAVTPVPLAPGAQAHAVLLFSQTGYQGSPECGPTASATSMRIYAPDSTTAIDLSFPADVCTGDVAELNVEPVVPGPSEQQ